MADSLVSYAIVAGIFAFLTAILFGTRARRISRSHGETTTTARSSYSEAA